MGLIEKIGRTTYSLTTNVSVFRKSEMLHSYASGTCVSDAPLASNAYRNKHYSGAASVPIDRCATRINHLVFNLENKIYILMYDTYSSTYMHY